MRILVDARLYGLENAGLGRYVMNLVQEFANQDRNNEYTILLRKKYFNQLKLPSNFTKVLADFRHYSVREQLLLPFLIRKFGPDIVHYPHFNVPLMATGRFVVTIHDLLMHGSGGKGVTTLNRFSYIVKRFGYKLVFRKAVKASKRIIVPSNFVKSELVRCYGVNKERIVVTVEGVDSKITLKRNNAGILDKYNLVKPFVIYTGNAYPHKNLKRAIKAIILLKKEVTFAIVSSRDVFTKRLQKTIKELKAGKQVKLLGFVPDDELAVLYKSSVCFLFPSLSEGFGLPGLEAMSIGTVLLVSDISVFREVYGDGAIYFDPRSTFSIKNSLDKVLSLEPQGRLRMLKKGKQISNQYSWTKMAKKTLSVYNEAL